MFQGVQKGRITATHVLICIVLNTFTFSLLHFYMKVTIEINKDKNINVEKIDIMTCVEY